MCSAIGRPRILLEDVEERQVAVLIRLLEDAVEIADRLMIVQDEDQAKRRTHDGQSCRVAQRRVARARSRRSTAVILIGSIDPTARPHNASMRTIPCYRQNCDVQHRTTFSDASCRSLPNRQI